MYVLYFDYFVDLFYLFLSPVYTIHGQHRTKHEMHAVKFGLLCRRIV